MKEILFRGKRVDNGEWVYGFYALFASNKGLKHGIHTGAENGCVIPYEVDPETVGQFTGLTDKNGKKIFEGDIVKGDLGLGYGDNENHIAYIEYQEDGMSFCLVEILEEDFGKCAEISDDLEVIGNIHDNPELLEEL
jgi:uncharacterized phage protein (TIGR01671 family)